MSQKNEPRLRRIEPYVLIFLLGLGLIILLVTGIGSVVSESKKKCLWECQSGTCVSKGKQDHCKSQKCPLNCKTKKGYTCLHSKKCIAVENEGEFDEKSDCTALCPFEVGKTVLYKPDGGTSHKYTACVTERGKDYVTIDLGSGTPWGTDHLVGTRKIDADAQISDGTIMLTEDGHIDCEEGEHCTGLVKGCVGNGGDRLSTFDEKSCADIVQKHSPRYTLGSCVSEGRYDGWTVGCEKDIHCPTTTTTASESRSCITLNGQVGINLPKTCSCSTDNDCTFPNNSNQEEKFKCELATSGKRWCQTFR